MSLRPALEAHSLEARCRRRCRCRSALALTLPFLAAAATALLSRTTLAFALAAAAILGPVALLSATGADGDVGIGDGHAARPRSMAISATLQAVA
eukprot:1414221-Heterocapsa_arctica.AAC.1